MMKQTWNEKLNDSKDLPKVVKIKGKMVKRFGRGTIVIPAPLDVDAYMRKVKRGQLTTIDEIRRAIAADHQANTTCPMVTGIHASIAARAAHELEAAGKKRVTPYWRTLRAGGQLNPKYPGGLLELKKRLESEGHKIIRKGNHMYVGEFKSKLAKL